jgi:hypothetical protein
MHCIQRAGDGASLAVCAAGNGAGELNVLRVIVQGVGAER